MIGWMVLHWGEVDRTIVIEGGSPANGIVDTIRRSSSLEEIQGRGTVKGVTASGGTKKISGSGGSG